MGVLGRMFNAGYLGFQTGIAAARRVFEDPATAYQEQGFVNRAMQYSLLWAYYNNSMFEKLPRLLNSSAWTGSFWGGGNINSRGGPWGIYKQNYNLYRNIRLIYNPTRRLVDFYAGQIYPGVLSEDGDTLPDGIPLAVPFAKDTDPYLKDAIAQFWQWSNWQAKKSLQVRYGAALGSVLIELIDDVEHGKVVADMPWPGFIYDLELDAAGNVKSYVIQYQAYDDETGAYLYTKQIDAQSFRYFRDDKPFDYGYGSTVENPYGFVPAVWIKHMDVGGDHGSPAIAGSFGKIDELNNLASHVHDQIHKVIGAPLVMWSDGSIKSLFNTPNRTPTADFIEPASDKENTLMLKGPANGRIDSLAGNLSLADSAVYMDKLITEIETDHPELTLYQELRSMSQVTGPAASRLVGDVASRVSEVQSAYDTQNMKLFQMAVAMSGFRANSGAWGALNRQQQKFTEFNLDSYQRGDLDIAIMPRPLLMPTKLEHAQEQQAFWTGMQAATTAGAPLEFALRGEGYSDEDLTQLGDQQAAQIQRDQLLATEDKIPAVGQ